MVRVRRGIIVSLLNFRLARDVTTNITSIVSTTTVIIVVTSFILYYLHNDHAKYSQSRRHAFVTVGKLHLSLHHAVPVEVCPTAYTGHWQTADRSQGEFYPGRTRPSSGAAIIPRPVMHRGSNKGSQ